MASDRLFLQPADIRKHWDQLRDGIAKAIDGDIDRPEDVYAACTHGEASLYLGPDAAFILRLGKDRDLTYVRVWVMFSWGRGGALDRYDAPLTELARSFGATRLSFATRREGFDRALPAGWKKAWTTHVKEI